MVLCCLLLLVLDFGACAALLQELLQTAKPLKHTGVLTLMQLEWLTYSTQPPVADAH